LHSARQSFQVPIAPPEHINDLGIETDAGLFNTHFHGLIERVNIISLRVLDSNSSATDGTVIAAIERAIQLKTQYNIRVINLSLGRPVFESYSLDPLCQAVQ